MHRAGDWFVIIPRSSHASYSLLSAMSACVCLFCLLILYAYKKCLSPVSRRFTTKTRIHIWFDWFNWSSVPSSAPFNQLKLFKCITKIYFLFDFFHSIDYNSDLIQLSQVLKLLERLAQPHLSLFFFLFFFFSSLSEYFLSDPQNWIKPLVNEHWSHLFKQSSSPSNSFMRLFFSLSI